jgi:hypothetical protein
MLGYDSNSRAYHIFSKDSGCVETMCDAVFDETNSSQVEQHDLDDVDDEDTPCDALRTMAIGDVRPQEVHEDQPSSNEATPPNQQDDQDQEGEQDEDDDQDHDMGNDLGELCKMKMRMIKKSQDHHYSLFQELGKPFNVTIRSTTFLVP